MYNINVYTAGSAVVSGRYRGRGGFGTYFPDLLGKPRAYSNGYWNTKTGRMEITALLYAIKAIPLGLEVQLNVYSDSQYVTKSFTECRLEKWVQNNWISYGNDIANKDLWIRVLDELKVRPKLDLNMIWIKGHQLDKENNPISKSHLLQNPHILGNAVADRFADYKRFKEEDLKTDL